MINAEQYLAEIDARAKKYASAFATDVAIKQPDPQQQEFANYILIKRAMLDAASLVNDAWLREMARAMEECKPKE